MLGERKGIYHQPELHSQYSPHHKTLNVNLTPYDDRTLEIHNILQVLGPDHEVFSKGSSISTAKFALELTTLKLIMFSNLYLLSNTTFINLGRAQFLCDLITGESIDIYAHIFQIIRKTVAQSAA